MEPLEIRLARPEEYVPTTQLWVRSRWKAEPALEKRMNYTREQNLEYFAEVLAKENAIWLALRGGRILGLLAYRPGRPGVVDQLFVEPAEQRTGVGRALLDHAKALSPEGLELFTHQTNTQARAFYESQDFEATAFGISPPPESEPDVTFVWRGAANA